MSSDGRPGRFRLFGRRQDDAAPGVERLTLEQAGSLAGTGSWGPPMEGPLRVGYVVWDWPALSQTFVLSEIQQLQSLGHDVVVYFKVDAEVAAEVTFEVVVRRVTDADELAALVVSDARQVLHTPFAYPGATRLVWPAAEASGIPFTFMAGGVDVAHYENIKRNRVGEVASSPLCLGVITLGRFHRDLLQECGVPSGRVVMERQSAVIPDLVERSAREGRPTVVSIARFIEKKGLEYLVRAAVDLPDVDVVLHGYGPLEDQLRDLADSLGASNVVFAGPLRSQAELDRAYATADVFALPCVRAADGDLDGLPTVLLEAMGSGLPVVTTSVANIPDLVVDGATGFLAEPRDTPSLVDAVRRALALDDERRATLVSTARRHAVGYAGGGRTTETLLRLWRRTALDVVLVLEPGGDATEAADALDRLYRFTSLPTTVTVVDTTGDDSLVASLGARFAAQQGFRVVALQGDVRVAEAFRAGARVGRASVVVDAAGGDALVLRHGWDHQVVRVLQRTGASLGGRTVDDTVPDEQVDGVLAVVRRDAFDEVDRDDPDPWSATDLVRRVRGTGGAVTEVPGVVSRGAARRPGVMALVDEFTVAVHPVAAPDAALLDDVVARRVRLCPLCAWSGPAFGGDGGCPRCASTPASRAAWRAVCWSGALVAGARVLVVMREGSVGTALRDVTGEGRVVLASSAADADAQLAASLADSTWDLVVVDRYEPADERHRSLVAAAAAGAVVVLGATSGAVAPVMSEAAGAGVHAVRLDLLSQVCGFATDPLVALGASEELGPPQGTEV